MAGGGQGGGNSGDNFIDASTVRQNAKTYLDNISTTFKQNHAEFLDSVSAQLAQNSTKGIQTLNLDIPLKEKITNEEFEYFTKQFLEKEKHYKVTIVKGQNIVINAKEEVN